MENQNILSILNAGIAKDISNQKLITSVTRGAVSPVNNQYACILVISEGTEVIEFPPIRLLFEPKFEDNY